MNLGRIKTFLIVLFLGINIYLATSLFMSTRFFIDSDTIENTVKLLEDNKITVDQDLIMRSVVNLKNTETGNTLYTDKFEKSDKNKFFEIKDDNFVCKKEEASLYNKSDRKIRKQISEFLESAGFSTKYMEFGKISKKKPGTKKFTIKCIVDGYEIFDSNIKVEVTKTGFTLKGSWYEPSTDEVKSDKHTRNTVYITSVLVSMLQNDKIMKNAPFEITDISYGYLAGSSYGKGAHITASASPYYRIKDNRGNIYYYDAKNGTYLK